MEGVGMVSRAVLVMGGITTGLLLSFEVPLNCPAIAVPDYPACYIITTSGKLQDLNSLCRFGDGLVNSPLRFSEMGLQVAVRDARPQLIVKGIVTNASAKRVPVSKVNCQLLLNDRIISTNQIPIITGRGGLHPGESRSFNQALNIQNLEEVSLSNLRVKVTSFSQ